MNDKVKNILSDLLNLSIAELNELFKLYAQELGVSVSDLIASGSIQSGSSSAVSTDEDKPDTFKITVKSLGSATQMTLIKRVRSIFSDISILEAKKKVESMPFILKENLTIGEKDALNEDLKKDGYDFTVEKE